MHFLKSNFSGILLKMYWTTALGNTTKIVNTHYKFKKIDIFISQICVLFISIIRFCFFSLAIMDIYLQNSQDPRNKNWFHCSYHFVSVYHSRKVSPHLYPASPAQHLYNCLLNPCIEYVENNLLFHSLHLENGHFPFEFLCDGLLLLRCKSLHRNQVEQHHSLNICRWI